VSWGVVNCGEIDTIVEAGSPDEAKQIALSNLSVPVLPGGGLGQR